MTIGISNSHNSAAAIGVQANQTQKSGDAQKPVWNNSKVYTYVDDFGNAGIEYGKKCQSYYATITAKDGEMSVEDLKKQIGEMFSMYTLTNRKPTDVVKGKHLLYIDDNNLKKMANDPSYRAKVYGLMDREYTTGESITLKWSDGRNVTEHVTGSYFTLCDENRKYAGADGVPYLGGCSTDHPWSSSDSHPQFRSQSYIYDHLDPAKSAAKDRAAAKKNNKPSTAKTLAERQAKKLKEKQAQKAKDKKKAEQERFEEMLEKRAEAKKEAMDDIADAAEDTTTGQIFDYFA